MFKLSKLKYKDRNPRKISDEALERLRQKISDYPKFLSLRPIIFDPATMQVLGGNQRLKSLRQLGYKEIPETWVKAADELTEEEKKAFVVIDNVSDGNWDSELLLEDWDAKQLEDWGIDLPSFTNIDDIETSDEFSLPEGDRSPFQQMTFTLADEQAEYIKNAISDIKKTDEYKYMETMGNENGNGNSLYLLVTNATKKAS